MLWYKAWLETRARFLISLAGIITLCSYTVYHASETTLTYAPEYFYSMFHSAHETLAIMWVMAVTLLMMGGLLREKAVGASPFTLALPVSRTHLMNARISVGLVEGLALILVPSGSMFLIASIVGKAPPIAQTGFHIVLLAGGGLFFLAIALLVSSLVEGEYTAPTVSFAILIAIAFGMDGKSLRAYSPLVFIMGNEYINRRQGLLVGPIPWNNVAVYLSLAAFLILISVKVIRTRDFS